MLRLCVIASLLIAFVTKTQADITPWTEMKVQNGHISIPVKVSAIDTHAVLDTGSQLNAINRAFRNKNNLSFSKGKKVNVRGINGIEKSMTVLRGSTT